MTSVMNRKAPPKKKAATIIEQKEVKDNIQRVVDIFKASEGDIRPHFMLTGPSGCGKSHIIQAIAESADLSYLEINAAQLTKEGTSGNSLSKALAPIGNHSGTLTLCFVDEFDKLFISGNSNSSLAHETTNGVQNEFLRVLEADTTSVFGDYGKYVEISIKNVLFVFAGAFNGEDDITVDKLRNFGIKTEFLGRVGLVYNLEKLSIESMQVALDNSNHLSNYLKLFPNIKKEDAVETIMRVVVAEHDKNTLGIRFLNTLINQYFINDGILGEAEIVSSSFRTTLDFKPRTEH